MGTLHDVQHTYEKITRICATLMGTFYKIPTGTLQEGATYLGKHCKMYTPTLRAHNNGIKPSLIRLMEHGHFQVLFVEL